MKRKVDQVLFSEEQIRQRVAELAGEITRHFQGQPLLCIGLLRGAFVFLADLTRKLDLDVEVEFIRCSSYGHATVSKGTVDIEFAENPAVIEGRNVLVVDDILDGGFTLQNVFCELQRRGAKDLKTCALLDKPLRRSVEFQADFVGFTVEDVFVVGYGMDYGEKYRNLPFIGTIRPEE